MKPMLRGLIILVTGVVISAFTLSNGKENGSKRHYTKAEINHGAYLVNAGGCNDCHSPKVMTPKGPVPGPDRLLSGAPADEKIPEVPRDVLGPHKWGVIADHNLTTWVGPWGISFSANLTPDSSTGIGGWTEQMFIECLRKGKYWGNGRPLLPPMPWQNIGRMSTNDLRDIFAYLMSIRPVHNSVHAPIPPAEAFGK